MERQQSANYYPQLRMYLSGRKLKDMDTFSKSDPIVQVLERNGRDSEWFVLGQTEVIWDNLNPDFTTTFLLDYHFEEQKYLYFKVFDAEDKACDLNKADYIGECHTVLSEILTSPGQHMVKTLTLPEQTKSRGNLIIKIEEVKNNNDYAHLKLSARNLPDISGWFRKFKPMIYISRMMENGLKQRVYTTEPRKGKNVSWDQFELSMQLLWNNELDTKIIAEVYDHHSNGSHKYVTHAEFTLRDVTENAIREFPLMNPKQKNSGSAGCVAKQSKKNSTIIFDNFDIVRKPTFLDYIAGGCKINLVAAVDFTASNMHPSHRDSLHNCSEQSYNHYQSALHTVGEILLNYDSDKKVPMYGFGAKIEGSEETSHWFPMTFDPNNSEVLGIEGIMEAYKMTLNLVDFAGPTHFANIIQQTIGDAEEAQVSQSNQEYFVLLIITDGDIHDMQETINAIVAASFQPISIVIVGLGSASFESMVVLDADDDPLVDSYGRTMSRDIVQFLAYRKVQNSPTRLAKEVLDELPREIVNFFMSKMITPNPPPVNYGAVYNPINA